MVGKYRFEWEGKQAKIYIWIQTGWRDETWTDNPISNEAT